MSDDLIKHIRSVEVELAQFSKLESFYTPYRVTYGTAAPVGGTWVQGDRVYNTAPTSGSYDGWVCTAGGTPGTWKGFGLIA